jgi:DNA-binding transcriptional ArsR family regulator
MLIEDVFSSKQRMKILKLIFQLGNLNVSDISRRTNSNFGATNKHLLVLEEEGILQVRTYGRIRMYRFNESSPKAKAVQNLLETWEQVERKKTNNGEREKSVYG